MMVQTLVFLVHQETAYLAFDRESPFTGFGEPGCVSARENTEREAARAVGQGYVSEDAGFGATHFQSGTDFVGYRLINAETNLSGRPTFIIFATKRTKVTK